MPQPPQQMRLAIETFLGGQGAVVDVRSPGEFRQGHMPGAHNLPLFDDGQRAQVGTTYKHKGRQAAVLHGLALVGPRMVSLGTALLAVLAASASYIAAPAAMRIAVPEANPALSITAALAVTFPFNLLLGIPLYTRLAEWLHRA